MNFIDNYLSLIDRANSVKIPRIIHYVWVGNNKLDNSSMKYIKSWKINNFFYKYTLWNETNIDFSIPYIKNAYLKKKWANVSNLARLLAVYNHGGIYMDTDILSLKSLNPLRKNNCFFGFQVEKYDKDWVNNAIFGAVKNHWFIKKLINRLVNDFNGEEAANLSSPALVTTLLKEEGLIKYSKEGIQLKDMFIYPKEYFYPYFFNEKFTFWSVKKNTYAIHLWKKRWE